MQLFDPLPVKISCLQVLRAVFIPPGTVAVGADGLRRFGHSKGLLWFSAGPGSGFPVAEALWDLPNPLRRPGGPLRPAGLRPVAGLSWGLL